VLQFVGFGQIVENGYYFGAEFNYNYISICDCCALDSPCREVDFASNYNL
jgi:hypothetical protein